MSFLKIIDMIYLIYLELYRCSIFFFWVTLVNCIFQEIVHCIYVVKFTGIKLFITSSYPFYVDEICWDAFYPSY